MPVRQPKTKDNAKGQLNASISAAATTIQLKTGEGALFPQPYTGTATSLGTRTTLNKTGIGSSGIAVDDLIHNVTDGSWAFVTVVSANSLTTTRLMGGTDNTWDNSDAYAVNEFILTLVQYDALGNETKREKTLCTGRSTDQVTVTRGYESTTADTFDADDYAELRVTSSVVEELKEALADLHTQIDTNVSNISNLQLDAPMWLGTVSGTDTLTGTASPAITAYTAGQRFCFIAANDNTATVTLNVNSVGAKTIKWQDGATNLSAGQIQAGQLVVVMYDGTNLQMVSPIGLPNSSTNYARTVWLGPATSGTLTNPTSTTAYDTHTYTIPANELINGVEFEWDVCARIVRGTTTNFTFALRTGGTDRVASATGSIAASTTFLNARGRITGTAAAGASVDVRFTIELLNGEGGGGGSWDTDYAAVNLATNGTLVLTWSAFFGTSNGGNNTYIYTSKVRKESTTAF